MGQDYSYTQPSSSDGYDVASLLLAEAQCYADEAESSYTGGDVVVIEEMNDLVDVGDGIQRTCYCGCDVAAEEMNDLKRQHRELKDHVNESDQKLVTVEKTVAELSKKNSGATVMVCVLVLIALAFMFLTGRASKD